MVRFEPCGKEHFPKTQPLLEDAEILDYVKANTLSISTSNTPVESENSRKNNDDSSAMESDTRNANSDPSEKVDQRENTSLSVDKIGRAHV